MTRVSGPTGLGSPCAWRVGIMSVLCIGVGGGGIYLPVVALKEIAAEFGDRRAVPSMAYMLGFFAMGLGGVFMGWLADRTRRRVPLLIPALSILPARRPASAGPVALRLVLAYIGALALLA